MILKKFFYFLIFNFFFLFLMILNLSEFYSLSFLYFPSDLGMLEMFEINLFLDFFTVFFFFMVFLVTSLVTLYSEIYMEHYNNKKFFVLMSFFFFFMALLSSSGSFILFFLGWDGLGISSICLIMFYPNKNTLYNSLLTMFFNRLGDVILIFLMGKILMNFENFFFLSTHYSFIFLVLLIFCSFTKSAQFPLSSWLPAAMSAPTPISAMVHSSTLVTAGILVNQFFFCYFLEMGLNVFIFSVSLLTFLLGGFMGLMELDFKKVIAFSTMSQISMILVFCSMNFLYLGMLHMIFHAFFKTFLFMSAGLFFIFLYSKQLKNFINLGNHSSVLISSLFFLSVFSMSGLIFSSSFFSKDLILEMCCSMDKFFVLALLILGSVLTIFYSCKLVKSLNSSPNSNKITENKKFFFFFLMFFMIFVLFPGQYLKSILMIEDFPFLAFSDLMVINYIFVFFLFVSLNFSKFSFLISNMFGMTFEIFFMKYFAYGNFNKIFSLENIKSHLFSDTLMFKTLYLSSFKEIAGKNFYSNFYGILLFLLTFMKILF